MLESDRNRSEQLPLVERIARYTGEVMHAPMKFEQDRALANLPIFLTRAYSFFSAEIAGRICLLMLQNDQSQTPGDMVKHVQLAEAQAKCTVILGLASLSARSRTRLIKQRVSFIVPGNQFYVPDLGMDLREHFKARRTRPSDDLSPVAQAVLFHYLLRRNEHATTPSAIATDLRYSPMSVGRAFDDLVAAGLAVSEKQGRERHLLFEEGRFELLERARPLLRSPVRSRKLVRGRLDRPHLLFAGETALAEMTDLAPPKLATFALAATEWRSFAARQELRESDFDEPDFVVETWSYDPQGLSDGQTVDPLSLYAQFHNHEDARVRMAAEKLRERSVW